jgi:GTP-binding protein HflX
LCEAIAAILDGARAPERLALDFASGRARAWLFDQGIVETETESEDGWQIDVRWTPRQRRRFDAMLSEEIGA